MHTKRLSPSSLIREVPVTAAVGSAAVLWECLPFPQNKAAEGDSAQVQGCGTARTTTCFAGGDAKGYNHFEKVVWQFLINLNICFSYDPAVLHEGLYPRDMQIYLYTKACIWLLIAALFLFTEDGEQLGGPSGGKCVNRLRCTCAVGQSLYSNTEVLTADILSKTGARPERSVTGKHRALYNCGSPLITFG